MTFSHFGSVIASKQKELEQNGLNVPIIILQSLIGVNFFTPIFLSENICLKKSVLLDTFWYFKAYNLETAD